MESLWVGTQRLFLCQIQCQLKDYLFTSERIGFRTWEDSDQIPFGEMNRDPEVMEFMPSLLTQKESDKMVERIQTHFETFGFGLFAVELLAAEEFIGFVGFQQTRFEAAFAPCFEIGWRLTPKVWGKGIATEAGLRCVTYGFGELELEKICSFTALANKRAQRVIEKVGLMKIGEFDHPKLEEGNWLRKHVLYNIERPTFN